MKIFNLSIMKKALVLLTILAVQLLNSQGINDRKGQFFVSGGVNRSFYSTSDISFKGTDFNFTLQNVKADDRRYLDTEGFTFSQANLKIGYFFNDNYNIVFGFDNMKYVLRNGEDVRIKGAIATGEYLYNEVLYNFDNIYDYNNIHLSDPFLLYEHDGLKYIYTGVNRFDNLNKLLGINTDKFEVNLEEGIDFGFVMPKTNTTILGNDKYENSGIVGFGMSANAGVNLTFFKHFFVKAAIKYGYINMKDSRVAINDASATVNQHFDFIESSYTFGVRFHVFKPKKKYTKKEQDLGGLDNNEIQEEKTEEPQKKISKETQVVSEPKQEVTIKNTTDNTIDCPGDKSKEYKEKSNSTTDKQAQKGYSWLSLYYAYKCKCDNGSIRPNELKGVINNVVDSYISNTGGIYGEISKVSKCKPLTKD